MPEPPLLSFNDCCKALTTLKRTKGTQWLKLPIAQALQQTLRDQDRAIPESFKKGKGFPRFKSRDHGDSFRLPQPKREDIDEVNAVSRPEVRVCALSEKSRHSRGDLFVK